MRVSRWIELGCGLAAGLLGLPIIVGMFVHAVFPTSTNTCVDDPSGTPCSQVNQGIPPLALFLVGASVLLLLGVVVSALLHWHLESAAWRRVLWNATGLLALVTLVGLDIFYLIIPSVLLALGASLAARVNDL